MQHFSELIMIKEIFVKIVVFIVMFLVSTQVFSCYQGLPLESCDYYEKADEANKNNDAQKDRIAKLENLLNELDGALDGTQETQQYVQQRRTSINQILDAEKKYNINYPALFRNGEVNIGTYHRDSEGPRLIANFIASLISLKEMFQIEIEVLQDMNSHLVENTKLHMDQRFHMISEALKAEQINTLREVGTK